MSWEDDIEELRRRQARAREMGGEERVAKHRSLGKLTVRERIERLVDPDSFHEIGSITGQAQYGPSGEMLEFRMNRNKYIFNAFGPCDLKRIRHGPSTLSRSPSLNAVSKMR